MDRKRMEVFELSLMVEVRLKRWFPLQFPLVGQSVRRANLLLASRNSAPLRAAGHVPGERKRSHFGCEVLGFRHFYFDLKF